MTLYFAKSQSALLFEFCKMINNSEIFCTDKTPLFYYGYYYSRFLRIRKQRNAMFTIIAHISDEYEWCGKVLAFISWVMIVLTLPFSLCFSLKVVQEYERAVIFRLGRLLPGGAKGPGIFFIIPCIDTYRKVDLRVVSFDVPPQEVTISVYIVKCK